MSPLSLHYSLIIATLIKGRLNYQRLRLEIDVFTFGGLYYLSRDHAQPNPSLGDQSLVLKIYIRDSTDKLFRRVHVYIGRITQLPVYAHRK